MSQYPTPPSGPQDPYGPGYGQPPAQEKKGMAIAALVLGILALVLCWTVFGGIVFGLIALILGIIAARRGAGRVMAIIGAVLGVIGIALAGILIAVGVSFLNSDAGQELQDCIADAGDDQAAIDQCERDLEDDLTN